MRHRWHCGWLPPALLGSAGALVLLAVTDLALGLDPLDLAGTAGISVLAVCAFTALAQTLRTWLGLVGSAIMLVILIVQLGAAGGLYPVEVMPAAFQVVHPWMPMTYLVEGLRVTISGGPAGHRQGVVVLAACWSRPYLDGRLRPGRNGAGRRRACARPWTTPGRGPRTVIPGLPGIVFGQLWRPVVPHPGLPWDLTPGRIGRPGPSRGGDRLATCSDPPTGVAADGSLHRPPGRRDRRPFRMSGRRTNE
ncbi:MAG: YhgE/Pip family protein [Micropruina glycogenica]